MMNQKAGAGSSAYNELYQLFIQKFDEMREDIRTRKMFTMLSNTKSLKIRTDKIDVPDASSITISMFKPQDKKMLIDLFCNDTEVQRKCSEIVQSLRHGNEDLLLNMYPDSEASQMMNSQA